MMMREFRSRHVVVRCIGTYCDATYVVGVAPFPIRLTIFVERFYGVASSWARVG